MARTWQNRNTVSNGLVSNIIARKSAPVTTGRYRHDHARRIMISAFGYCYLILDMTIQ